MAYTKGSISIPSVTGNLVITVTTEPAAPQPIEVYSGDASEYLLNYGAGNPDPIARAGSYLTNLIPTDFATRPCICIKGLNKSNGSAPQLYKVAFYKDGALTSIDYTQNFPITTGADGWNIDLSQSQYYSNLKKYNGIRLHIQLGSSAITAADVLPTSQVSVKLSASAIYN